MSDSQEIELLAAELGHLLQRRGWFLATAESCTGGWIAQAVTQIAGSSGWFDRGFITYSNIAKQEMLEVPREILEDEGAVSEQTVLSMVKGVLMHSQAQVAVAVSGIAGPSGGTPDKPVGTVWIAYAVPNHCNAQCYQLKGNRESIRLQSVAIALRELIQKLQCFETMSSSS